MAEGSDSSHSPPQKKVKGILKKTKSLDKKPKFEGPGDHSGIQWDEMNILMTESPADKDYGHMKIDEPKTPFHEMLPDEEGGGSPDKFLSPDDLARKVKEAAAGDDPSSRWEPESSGDDEEEFLSDEQKQHKKEFREWRKNHYNEFLAVKRARELMKQDEEELRQLEEAEAQGGSSGQTGASSAAVPTGDDEGEAMQQDGGNQT